MTTPECTECMSDLTREQVEAVRDCPADCDKCSADPVCCDEPDGLARDLATAPTLDTARTDAQLKHMNGCLCLSCRSQCSDDDLWAVVKVYSECNGFDECEPCSLLPTSMRDRINGNGCRQQYEAALTELARRLAESREESKQGRVDAVALVYVRRKLAESNTRTLRAIEHNRELEAELAKQRRVSEWLANMVAVYGSHLTHNTRRNGYFCEETDAIAAAQSAIEGSGHE